MSGEIAKKDRAFENTETSMFELLTAVVIFAKCMKIK